MKRRILALLVGLCVLLPVSAGAAQEPEICGYPVADVMQELPKTVTRGTFLDALAASSGEDVKDSAWIDMEDYFTDGAGASYGFKWAFAKWI